MILHSGEKTPDHPSFTPDPLFSVQAVPAYVLPGYPEPLVGGRVGGWAELLGAKRSQRGQPAAMGAIQRGNRQLAG